MLADDRCAEVGVLPVAQTAALALRRVPAFSPFTDDALLRLVRVGPPHRDHEAPRRLSAPRRASRVALSSNSKLVTPPLMLTCPPYVPFAQPLFAQPSPSLHTPHSPRSPPCPALRSPLPAGGT